MKQFEEKMVEMKIPEKEDIFFEKRLRSQLIDRFVRTETNYLWHYRIAAGIACFFALFTFVMLFIPVENNQALAEMEPTELIEKKEVNNTDLDRMLHYTSAENPVIANELGSNQYSEEKSYFIRRYVTAEQETVTVVTEIESQMKPIPVKRRAY